MEGDRDNRIDAEQRDHQAPFDCIMPTDGSNRCEICGSTYFDLDREDEVT